MLNIIIKLHGVQAVVHAGRGAACPVVSGAILPVTRFGGSIVNPITVSRIVAGIQESQMQLACKVVIQTLSPIGATKNNNTPSPARLWSHNLDTLSTS